MLDSQETGAFGTFAGVGGVFRTRKADATGTTQGHSIDRMVQMLREDFPLIDSEGWLLDVLTAISHGGAAGVNEVLPSTDDLAKAGIVQGTRWWEQVTDLPGLDTFEQGPAKEPVEHRLRRGPTFRIRGRLRPSTRMPSNLNSPAALGVLTTFLDTARLPEAAPFYEKAAENYRKTHLVRTGVRTGANDDAAIEAAIRTMVSNLRVLWNEMDPVVRERARQWYVGAHKIANGIAAEFDLTREQGAALLAVLSPQKDWNRNISLARRVAIGMQALDASNPVFDGALWKQYETAFETTRDDRAKTIRKREEEKLANGEEADPEGEVQEHLDKKNALFEVDKRTLRGVAWKDQGTPGQARMLRAWDEITNSSDYSIYSPEGKPVKRALNLGTLNKRTGERGVGEPSKVIWQKYISIENAVRVMRGASIPNLDVQVGDEHKVRSFYANILDPTNPNAVTIDTHSVAAAFLSPWGAGNVEVMRTLGRAGTRLLDVAGLAEEYGPSKAFWREVVAKGCSR